MNGFKVFYWRDEPIINIEQWAKDRQEKIAIVIWMVKDINPYAKRVKDMITYHEESEEMPESFINSLRYGDDRKIKEILLRDPIV